MSPAPTHLPVVALTLGDPAGIGSELIAKLLHREETTNQANVVLVGDPWLWEFGQKVAGLKIQTQALKSMSEVRSRTDTKFAAFVSVNTFYQSKIKVGQVSAEGGQSVLKVLDQCMDAALGEDIDAICFAPLNKQGMKLGGLKHEDEMHYFAEYLNVKNYTSEINILGGLWTSRVSSHVPLKDVCKYIQPARIKDAARLIYRALQANGVSKPRVAVAGLNPHNGDGGSFGREEIDIIRPAVEQLQAEGVPVSGPFPADTIFLKARDGGLDAVVTMYHDQGQIALKLLGFSQGVTVLGGLPIPIMSPAHGTAYDIAGQGKANVDALVNAFRIGCRMGSNLRQGKALF